VFGALRAVEPVEHRGHAGVKGLEPTEQVAEIDVLGPVAGAQPAVDRRQVLGEGARGAPPHRRRPAPRLRRSTSSGSSLARPDEAPPASGPGNQAGLPSRIGRT